MRAQYHLWPAASGDDFDAWDVHQLIELTRDLPVHRVAVDSIAELDVDYWTDGTPSPRQVAVHLRLALEVDPSYPIILGPGGRVMDGMHRLVRALLDGRDQIDAVTLRALPEPDHRNVRPQDLSY